jgi:hypothetical protein
MNIWEAIQATIYKVTHLAQKISTNSKSMETVGLKTPSFGYMLDVPYGLNPSYYANTTTVHPTAGELASMTDRVRIQLDQVTTSVHVLGASIYGKAVLRFSGEEGYLHDKFVDYERIAQDGEKKLEWGNNFICDPTQINTIADFLWKWSRTKKHVYSLTFPGFLSYFEPCEWYTLDIGGAGQEEYISATCECYSMRATVDAGGLGATEVVFREIEASWKFDSTEVARMLASGTFRKIPSATDITIAPSDYMAGDAAVYCTGTDDDVIINSAIADLMKTGGGRIRLLPGYFHTTDTIHGDSNIEINLMPGCYLTFKDCNAINCIGTSGSHKVNFSITGRGTIIEDTSSSADYTGIELDYIDNLYCTEFTMNYASNINRAGINGIYVFNTSGIIENINIEAIETLDVSDMVLILIWNCSNIITDNIAINNIHNTGGWTRSIYMVDGDNYRIMNTNIYNVISENSLNYGIYVAGGGNGLISKNKINQLQQNYAPGEPSYGIIIDDGDDTVIENNYIEETPQAIYIVSGNRVRLNGNHCISNGDFIDLGTCESATAPMVSGETVPLLVNATFARSNTQAHTGTYSYKATKTIAAGTDAAVWLVDNNTSTDMHGTFANQEYRFTAWVYIPAGEMLGSELTMFLSNYYSAAWHDTTQACALTYDAWQLVTTDVTLNSAATGFRCGFYMATTVANNKVFYVDDIRLTPMGTANPHGFQLYDGGTDTRWH